MTQFSIQLSDQCTEIVHVLNGREEYNKFLNKFVELGTTQEKMTTSFGFFSRTRQTVSSKQPESSTHYALYVNGSHLAAYIFHQEGKSLTIEHCAPLNGRPVTPEIRSLLAEKIPSAFLVDVSSLQRGIYFNQAQDLVFKNLAEENDAFQKRAYKEGIKQIENYLNEHPTQRKNTVSSLGNNNGVNL